MFCTHDLLFSIVSDREKQLISKLWERICKCYRVKLKLFSAQHSETDDQTEIVNKFLKNYLQNYINYLQNDWINFLSNMKFMINNFVNKFIKMIFFFADKNYHLQYEVESLKIYIKQKKTELEWADKIVARIKFIWQWLQKQITWAQEKYEHHVNKIRQSHLKYHFS